MNIKLFRTVARLVLSISGIVLIAAYLFQKNQNPALLTTGLGINAISIALNARESRKKS